MVYRSEFFGGGFGVGNGVFVAIGDFVDDAVEEVFYSALVSILYTTRENRRKKIPRLVDHVPQKVAGYLDADEQRVTMAMADLCIETSLVEVVDEFLEFTNCLCVF